MNNDKELLGTAPVGRLLFKLSVPTIAAQLINMLYNIVDRIYIGHIDEVGSLALTGVGVCMPIILFVSAFAALIGMGGAPHASIFMGRGDKESAECTMGSCFSAQIIVSLVITAVLLIWQEDMLLLFGASESTLPYALDYMKIYALGTVLVEITLGMNAYITAEGRSSVAMITVFLGALINIALDPIFIFALGMGVKGAALATVISQAASALFAVGFLISKKSFLRIRLRNLAIRMKYLLPSVALGAAPFVMQASESVIAVAFNASLRGYGGDIAVGAMTILTSVMQFAMLPLQGLAQGAQPIIGYNFGAVNPERIKRVFKTLLAVSLAYSFLLWGAVMLFPRAFAAIFTSNSALISYTASVLRVYCSALLIFGIQVASQMTFVALGRALDSVTVAVMRKFVLLLPLILLLPRIFTENPALSVYLAEPVADILAVSFTAVLFAVRFKKIISELEKKKEGKIPEEK